MSNLIFIGIVGLIIIFPIIIIIREKPDFSFWLFLNLFFDPGGYVNGFLGGKLLGPFNITDIFILFIVLCLSSPKVNWEVIYTDKFLLKFFKYLFIFAGYYFIVYGGIVPYFQNDFDYSTFLIKNRVFIYGFIILISVYVFALRDLKYFYAITLFFGVICLTLYLITLLTEIPLIPVVEMLRYRGSEMMRIGLLSYGIFDLLFPLALTTYLLDRKLNLNIKYKLWLYYSGILIMLTFLITLTRRTQIQILGSALIIILITSYLFRTGKLTASLKILISSVLVVMALYIALPKYVDYVFRIGEDTFLLLTMGKDTRGEGNYRISGTGDLLTAKEYIKNNLFFGTGYTYLYWGDSDVASSPRGAIYASAADAAHEVPIYFLFFGFGIVGAVMMFPLYFIMAKLFLNLSKSLKQKLIIYSKDPYLIIYSIYFLLTIAGIFTFNIYNLSNDFTGVQFSSTALFMGLGFALYRKILIINKNI